MSRDRLRYRAALPAALLLIPLAAGPAAAGTDPGDPPFCTTAQTRPGPLQVDAQFTSWPRATERSNGPRGRAVEGLESPHPKRR